jgi:NarL family two-component system response regulator LiaR
MGSELLKLDKFLKIIIINYGPDYESAIDIGKSGFFDCISKSTDNEIMLSKIRQAVDLQKNELKIKENPLNNKINIILLGHLFLTKDGLKNFCQDNPEFCLLNAYHSYENVKKNDFNLNADLILICASCNHEFFKKPQKMFDYLKIIFPKGKPIIINSALAEDKKIELIRLGVKGFLPDDINKNSLKKALNCIMDGQVWISREFSQRLLSELPENTTNENSYQKPLNTFNLSKREIEILQALASGLSNFAISEKLFLSEKTVKTHNHHIFTKMQVINRTQAVMKAIKFHII